MKTLISNKIWITNPTLDVYMWAQNNLTIVNPTYATLKRIGKDEQIQRNHVPEKMKLYSENGIDLILPFGCLNAIWPLIKNYDVETRFNEHGQIMNVNEKPSMPLFDYQEIALANMLNARGGVLVAGCGSGKTNMAIEIIHKIGRKFLFLVHTKDLLNQFFDRAKLLYPSMDIGKITEGQYKVGKDGAVATIQTMVMLDKDLYKNEFDVVICDECAHVAGSPTLNKMFVKVVESIPARYKFGCTATPSRQDGMIKSMYTTLGMSLKGQFEPTYHIDREDIQSLTAEHIRVDLDTPFNYDILEEDGSLNYNNLINFLSTYEPRNDKIIDKILEYKGRKQLVLCARIEQCEILHKKLLEKGVKSVLLIGKVTNKKRQEILKEEVDWDVIVGTLSLAKEGLDVKSLSVGIWASPITDKAMTVQCAGRIERPMEGKPNPIILDFVDTEFPYCVGKYKKRVNYLKKRY